MKIMQKSNQFMLLMLVTVVVLLLPDLAHATQTSGTSWDAPLDNIRKAITGPVAYTISLLAIVVSGAMLAFGGEVNEFARRMIMVVLVISLIVFATQFLTQLWGTAGAVVDGVELLSEAKPLTLTKVIE